MDVHVCTKCRKTAGLGCEKVETTRKCSTPSLISDLWIDDFSFSSNVCRVIILNIEYEY